MYHLQLYSLNATVAIQCDETTVTMQAVCNAPLMYNMCNTFWWLSLHSRQAVAGCDVQIFLTANPRLRSEVAKQFHKLRAAVLGNPEESKRLEDLSNQDYPSLAHIPGDAFPLFWTTRQYLQALDATLPQTPNHNGPFFPRYTLNSSASKLGSLQTPPLPMQPVCSASCFV